jgi:hypothetical protein
MENFQYFIVDRFGNSAIIEGDEIIYKDGIYQVVTNFLQSDPSHGWFPCWRYNTAVDMLENMLDFSVGYFTEICNATHQEGSYPTVYSYVNDLENNIMYLYHYYDYDKVVVLDVNDEISRGEHTYYLPDLFLEEENNPPNTPYKINGEIRGKINREYEYTTNTIDPDGDKIFFIFDWDDGSKSEWLGPYDSEENIVISHTWNVEGEYEIRVKAKDIYGYESEWSDPLYISMPINKRLDLNLINFKIPYLKLNWLIRYILN